MIMIEGNTLVGVENVYQVPLKTSILGALLAKDEEYLVWTTYPEIYRVIECESGWNNDARGKAGEIGIAQFMPSTWKLFNQLRNTNLDIYNEADQIDMIIWSFQNGYQDHWTCFNNSYE